MEKVIIIVLASVLVNFALGTILHLGKNFSFKLFFIGLWGVIKKEIALVTLLFGYWYFADFEALNIVYAPIFYFIALLSVVYHLNSALVNICEMLGFQNVKVLGELDLKFKELMNKSFFKEGTE